MPPPDPRSTPRPPPSGSARFRLAVESLVIGSPQPQQVPQQPLAFPCARVAASPCLLDFLHCALLMAASVPASIAIRRLFAICRPPYPLTRIYDAVWYIRQGKYYGDDQTAGFLENTFKALADQTAPADPRPAPAGEICVCDIHGSLGLPQPTVSRHLAYLRKRPGGDPQGWPVGPLPAGGPARSRHAGAARRRHPRDRARSRAIATASASPDASS